jgi:hypothetical protein
MAKFDKKGGKMNKTKAPKKPKNPGTPKRDSKKHSGGKSHVVKQSPSRF